jgi:hypothetical protein
LASCRKPVVPACCACAAATSSAIAATRAHIALVLRIFSLPAKCAGRRVRPQTAGQVSRCQRLSFTCCVRYDARQAGCCGALSDSHPPTCFATACTPVRAPLRREDLRCCCVLW